jgi:uncharacterized membrane protein (DUF485 family)
LGARATDGTLRPALVDVTYGIFIAVRQMIYTAILNGIKAHLHFETLAAAPGQYAVDYLTAACTHQRP